MERIKVATKKELYALKYKSVDIEVVMPVYAAGAEFCNYFDSCLCCPFAMRMAFCDGEWRKKSSLIAIYKVSFDNEGYSDGELIRVETEDGIVVEKDGVPYYPNGEQVPKGIKI